MTHYQVPLYIFDRESLRKYTGRCATAFTAGGYYKGFIISWSALGVPIGFEAGRTAGLKKTFSRLRPAVARICPGREHIVPSAEEFDGQVGLGRIVALYHRSSTSYRIC